MHELQAAHTEGFLTAAFNDGLSKEAAAELLMHCSVQRFAAPGYAEGFYTNGVRPVVHQSDFEKSAAGNLGKIWGGIRQIGSGLLGGAKSVGSGAIKATNIAVGAPRTVTTATGAANVVPSLISRYPRTGLALGAGATGVGALGLSQMGNSGPTAPYASPILGADGMYDGEGAQKRMDALSDKYSAGVFQLNKDLNAGGNKRMAELEAAVASGGPDSHMAAAELAKLRATRGAAAKTKMQYAKDLEQAGASADSTIARLAAEREALRAAREGRGIGGFFRRAFHNMNGDGVSANDMFDRQLADVQRRLGDVNAQRTLTSDQQRRLANGITAPVNIPTQAELQRNFFPTYQQ